MGTAEVPVVRRPFSVLAIAALAFVMVASLSSCAVLDASHEFDGLTGTTGHGSRPEPLVPTLNWQPCGALQCATATVPLDYDHPFGATIQLALVRRPAADPAHRIGTLFAQEGGPGSSGVDFVTSQAEATFPASVRARFDIVGFDPRGVARSAPVRCFASSDEQARYIASLPAFPVGREEEARFFADAIRLGHLCARSNVTIMRHVSTANVARDLELLRQAVGDPALTLFSRSYGTYVGETYANLFPDKVRALVLDGVIDPVAYATSEDDGREVPLFTRLHSDRAGEEALNQFLTLCKQAGSGCAFSSGSPREKLDTLLARLRRAHDTGTPVPVSYAALISTIYSDLYFPAIWGSLAGQLQSLYDQTAALPRASQATTPAPRGAASNYDNAYEAFAAITCVDTDNPTHLRTWRHAADEAAEAAPHFGALDAWFTAQCAHWPVRDRDRYTGPFTAHTASPVLVIGNRYDPVTPYQAAKNVAHQLSGARLLTYTGWGHTTLRGPNACVDDYLARYLLDRQLPPVGATCVPEHPPFR